MSNKSRQVIRLNKKNEGQEINLEFCYLASKEITYPEKIMVEAWVKTYATNMLHAFKMEFPGIMSPTSMGQR